MNITIEESRVVANHRLIKGRWWKNILFIFCSFCWAFAIMSIFSNPPPEPIQKYISSDKFGNHEVIINPKGTPSYLDVVELREIVVNTEASSNTSPLVPAAAFLPIVIILLYSLRRSSKDKVYRDAFTQYTIDNKEFPPNDWKPTV